MKAQFEIIKGKVEKVEISDNYRLAEFMNAFEDANREYNKKRFANMTYE